MLSDYFGFREEPFGVTPDPRCLYLSRTHQQALEALQFGFSSNRGFTAMIAPPGMGKTTLLFRFLEDVRDSARIVFLFDLDAQCEPREFVAYILRDLGIAPGESSAEMHAQLSSALVRENRAGRKFVVVIDEAQSLSDAVLERVRLLTNFETSQGKLMQIVLSGQPQLSGKLLQASLVQLRQHISTVCHIDPLSPEETAGYIDYRVKQAGYVGVPLFTEKALELITEASQGTPRTINNLCFNALSLCCKLNSKQVDSGMVAQVIAGLELTPQSREPIAAAVEVVPEQPSEPEYWQQAKGRLMQLVSATTGSVMFWVPAAALFLVLSFLGLFRLTEVRVPQSPAAGDDRPTQLTVPPASVPAPPAAKTPEPTTTQPAPGAAPLELRYAVDHPVSAPASASAASSPKPLQANVSIPKPSPAMARPAAFSPRLLHANASTPKPSSATVSPAPPSLKALQGNGSIPRLSAPTPPVVTLPHASAAEQPPSAGAVANPVTPQQSKAPSAQTGSPAGAPTSAAASKVRPALTGNAPLAAHPPAAPNVRPALPPLAP
jgi:general secretion pathway protein A